MANNTNTSGNTPEQKNTAGEQKKDRWDELMAQLDEITETLRKACEPQTAEAGKVAKPEEKVEEAIEVKEVKEKVAEPDKAPEKEKAGNASSLQKS